MDAKNNILKIDDVTDKKGVWFEGKIPHYYGMYMDGYALLDRLENYGNVGYKIAFVGAIDYQYVRAEEYGKTWCCYRNRDDACID